MAASIPSTLLPLPPTPEGSQPRHRFVKVVADEERFALSDEPQAGSARQQAKPQSQQRSTRVKPYAFRKQAFQPSVVGVPVVVPTATPASASALNEGGQGNGNSPGAPSRVKAFSTVSVLREERPPISARGPASAIAVQIPAGEAKRSTAESIVDDVISMTDIGKASSQVAIFKSTYAAEATAPGKVSASIYQRQVTKVGSKNSFVRQENQHNRDLSAIAGSLNVQSRNPLRQSKQQSSKEGGIVAGGEGLRPWAGSPRPGTPLKSGPPGALAPRLKQSSTITGPTQLGRVSSHSHGSHPSRPVSAGRSQRSRTTDQGKIQQGLVLRQPPIVSVTLQDKTGRTLFPDESFSATAAPLDPRAATDDPAPEPSDLRISGGALDLARAKTIRLGEPAAGTDRSDNPEAVRETQPSREGSPLALAGLSENPGRPLATPTPIAQGGIRITSKSKHSPRGAKQPTRFSPVKQRQIILQPYLEKVYKSHIREAMLED